MNYWLINPKHEGTNTDLSSESVDVVNMGWDEYKCPKFYNDVKKNDVIIVTEGAHYHTELHYIGIADYIDKKNQCWHLKYSTDKKNKEISQIIKNNPDDFGGGSSKNPWGRTKSIIKLTDNAAEIHIKQILNGFFMEKQANDYVENYKKILIANHNLILTGAPGTGKTYLAKQIAQQMIFGEVKKKITDDEGKQFDEQCGFVQFHPSYDYSDFVEGLRPFEKNGDLGFNRRDGVFKEFCCRAVKNLVDSSRSRNDLQKEQQITNLIMDFLNESLEKEIEFETSKSGNKFHVEEFDEDLIHISIPANTKRSDITISIYELKQLLLKNNVDCKKVKDIKVFFHRKHHRQEDSYVFVLFNKIKESNLENANTVFVEPVMRKNYVYIIDEINRGEISKIFGELFFAIDPGYRGFEKCRDLRTQYANLQTSNPNMFDKVLEITDPENYGHFFVPENVYIIGTMNDIDRSVESMDFAFRRRFAFKEITAKDSQAMLDSKEAWGEDKMPKPDFVQKVKDKMNAINKVIFDEEKNEGIEGLSSAYHIGASYFLKLANYRNESGEYVEKSFTDLWDNHLEGLLREYMRGMQNVDDKIKKLKTAYGYELSSNN